MYTYPDIGDGTCSSRRRMYNMHHKTQRVIIIRGSKTSRVNDIVVITTLLIITYKCIYVYTVVARAIYIYIANIAYLVPAADYIII